MSRKRVLRVGEAIKRELGFILDRKVDDPRIGMVTVTRVDLSEDLRHAKVFVSFLGDEEDKQRGMRFLKRAGSFLRSELASCLDLRVVPRLAFVLDDSSEHYLRISRVLKRIHEEDEESEQGRPSEDRGDTQG